MADAVAAVAEVDEVEEEAGTPSPDVSLLRRRKPPFSSSSAPTDTITAANGNESGQDQKGEANGSLLLLVDSAAHFASQNGTNHTYSAMAQHSISLRRPQDDEVTVIAKDFDIQRSISSVAANYTEEIVNDKIVPSVDHLTSDKPGKITRVKPSNSGTEAHLGNKSIKGSDEDVVELDLERFLEDPDAYDLYCPNCSCCIKKVILRKRIQESRAAHHEEPVDVFRCMSCFSFLVLAGRRFVSLFVPGKKEKMINEAVPDQTSPVSSVQNAKLLGQSSDNLLAIGVPADNQKSEEDPAALANKYIAVPNQTGPVLSIQNANSLGQSRSDLLAIGVSADNQKSEEDPVSFTTQGPPKEVIIKITGSSDDAITKCNTAGPIEPTVQTSQVLNRREEAVLEPRDSKGWDILKSIVYGGLIESITSLGIVTSAVGANVDTANILALGLANLIGGVFVLSNNLGELKTVGLRRTSNETVEEVDRYQELLGHRENFLLHATVAILSFVIFGTVPVVTYAFSFRTSGLKELKLSAAMAASLFCIIFLALGKAHIQKPTKLSNYIKTVLYYAFSGVVISGVSCIAGNLIIKLMEKLGGLKLSELALALPETKLLKSA